MPLVIDEAYLPVKLTAPPMSDNEFAEFCQAYPDYFIEMTADGGVTHYAAELHANRVAESKNQFPIRPLGLVGRNRFRDGSFGRFLAPDGARRSPDAAWTCKDRIRSLTAASLERYWHLCPDFVIELRSPSDRLLVLRHKMDEWIDNGALLAWLIDPESRTVEIYRPNREPEMLADSESVAGEGPVSGFVLNLRPVWDPLSY